MGIVTLRWMCFLFTELWNKDLLSKVSYSICMMIRTSFFQKWYLIVHLSKKQSCLWFFTVCRLAECCHFCCAGWSQITGKCVCIQGVAAHVGCGPQRPRPTWAELMAEMRPSSLRMECLHDQARLRFLSRLFTREVNFSVNKKKCYTEINKQQKLFRFCASISCILFNISLQQKSVAVKLLNI